jgi:chemotaxis protein methyltransferase CheR
MNLSNVDLTDDEFGRFRDLIYRLAGIRIPITKRVLIANRVRRRLRATGIDRFSDYLAFLNSPSGGTEQPLFLNEITTNETYFFRDPHQYAWFGSTFLPELARAAAAHRHPRSLRVWSAACSTGEELYSLILKYLEAKSLFAGWRGMFLGTDLSGSALAVARSGRYEARALRLVGPELRQRYFRAEPDGGHWILEAEARALATWKRHNLLLRPPEEPFDCVFLKNVLIYFDGASKRTVIGHVLRALVPGGYLVLGPTEGVAALLTSLTKIHAWLYQKPVEPRSSAR